MLKVETIVNGMLNENCYIVHNNKNALIIDPGSEENKIIKEIEKNNLNIIGILITHYHFDHIGALDYFKNKYNVPIYDNKTLGKHKIINLRFEILSTMGHSSDSVSFYFKETNDVFVGDFVFEGSIGRMDLEGGSEEEMVYSLKKLREFPKNTKLYPGHGNITTLEHELLYNPYL